MSRLAKSFFADADDPVIIEEEEKEYKRDVFEWMKAITSTKEQHHTLESLKTFDPWITTKFLSMREIDIHNVMEVTLTKHLNKLDTFRYLMHSVPPRNGRVTYLAKKRKNIDVVRERIISQHFQVGSRDVLVIIESLPKDELNTILEYYPEWNDIKKKK